MQIEYLLTLNEFAEACRASAAPKPSRIKARVISFGLVLGMWIVFSRLLGMLLTSPPVPVPALVAPAPGSILPVPQPTVGKLPTEQNLWTILAPPLGVAGFLALAVLVGACDNLRRARLALDTNSSPADLPPMTIRSSLSLSPFALWLLPTIPALEIVWHADAGMVTLVSFTPWIALLIVLIALGPFNRRSKIMKGFATQRQYRRLQKLEFMTDAVVIDNGLNRSVQHWSTIDRYQETKNLLKLILENEAVIIVPKRSFADSSVQDAVLGLIQNRIPKGTFLPRDSRFQVLPQPVVAIDEIGQTPAR